MTPMPDAIPPTLTVIAEPHESADELRDRHINVLLAHARHTAAQIAELVIMLREMSHRLDEHIANSAIWRPTIEAQIRANTEITQEIAERRSWWAGTKARLSSLKGWIVGIATTVAAVIGAWIAIAQLWGRGPPGGGIGPGP